jgi:hypothetical protein
MKNKEFIKKSIEENIVDQTAVLNNLKAKAATLESARVSSRPAGFAFRKAAVFAMMALLCASCVFSCMYLFNQDGNIAPPVFDDSSQVIQPAQSNYQTTSKNLTVESSFNSQSPQVDESREPKSSESSCSSIITEIPLNDEQKAFFDNFSDNFTVLQNLMNARLDAGTAKDEYAPVTDDNFQNVSDIKNFLYAFMKPEAAGEIYVGLTSGAVPYYVEKNGALYQLTDVQDNSIIEIKTETAFILSEEENTLIINAMLKTNGHQDYYHRFEFNKINEEWLYNEVWRTSSMLTNNTNNR